MTQPVQYKGRKTLPAKVGQVGRAARRLQDQYEASGIDVTEAEDQANADTDMMQRVKPYLPPPEAGYGPAGPPAVGQPRWRQHLKQRGYK